MEPVKLRYNNTWLGVVVGVLFPIFGLFCYWLFVHSEMGFPRNFIRYLLIMEMLGNTLILCTVANMGVFYLFLNRKRNDTARGIIYGSLVYVAIILYLMLFVETTAG
ncbi:MAG: hypothetical protein JST26_02765 [Bacteroidetes bacterium]|nr:hypothetical protein [Bacteroidota bacterium]